MPLFNKHPFVARAPPINLKPDQTVFHVKASGEVFVSYEEYMQRMNHIKSKEWTCELTGSSGLSFSEARESENDARLMLDQISPELEAELVKIVHHSISNQEALVTALYNKACVAQSSASEKKGEGKKLLKLWLTSSAKLKDKVWRITKESLLQKHSLSLTVPQDLLDSVRSPPKQKSKASLTQGGEGGEKEGEVGEVKKKPPRPKVLLSLEEEEKKLKAGSAKHAAFHLLKDQAHALTGLTAEDIIRLSNEQGIKKDWNEKSLETVKSILSSEVCFSKVSEKPSKYALTSMPGVVPMVKKEVVVDGAPRTKKATLSAAGPSDGSNEGMVPKKKKKAANLTANGPDTDANADDNTEGLSKAELKLQQVKGISLKHEASVKKAELLIQELEANLKEAMEKEATKSASKAKAKAGKDDNDDDDDDEEDIFADAPTIEVPDELKEYRGDPSDRKAELAFKKQRLEAEKELKAKRSQWILEQKKLSSKGKGLSVTDIKAKIKQAIGVFEAAKKGHESSLSALKEAEVAVNSEKQRKMIKEAKEKGKVGKEEEKERLRLEKEKEIERRKNNPLAKLKFPMDDSELYQILVDRSRELGLPPPVTDPARPMVHPPSSPPPTLPPNLPEILSISDLVHTFEDELGVEGEMASWKDLDSMIDQGDSLPSIYLSLLSFVLGKGRGDQEGTEEEEDEEDEEGNGEELDSEGHTRRSLSRWRAALDPNTWTEVLGLFLLKCRPDLQEAIEVLRRASSGSLPIHSASASEVGKVGRSKAKGPASHLTRSHHLTLLSALCEEAMSCHSMRVLLARRLTESQESSAVIKQELVNERKKLREYEEGAREAKKRKREAELVFMQAKAAKMHEEAAGQADKADKGTKEGGQEAKEKGKGKKKKEADDPAPAPAPAPGPPSKKAKIKSSSSLNNLAPDPHIDPEPSFELPEALREFQGSPSDRKGLVTFRQQQQKEKARLDKLKAERERERKEREKEREVARRAEEVEEKRREKGIRAAEEAIARHQEALEAEAERLVVRRAPLGVDRLHRKYWWGLGGYKEGLVIECPPNGGVEDSSGSKWIVVDDEVKIQSFLDSLDQRGQREAELKKALSRVMPEIKALLGKAPHPDPDPAGSLMEVDDPQPLVVERRVQPGRRGKPTDLTDGVKKLEDTLVLKKKKAAEEEEEEEEEEVEVQEEESFPGEHGLTSCLDKVDEIAASLSAARVSGPSGGWRAFRQLIKKLKTGDEAMDHDKRSVEMLAACKEKLGEIEALLSDATGSLEALSRTQEEMEVEVDDDEEEDVDLEVVESEEIESEVPRSKWGRCIWRSRKERSSWLRMLEEAETAPKLAYLSNVLSMLASGPLAAL